MGAARVVAGCRTIEFSCTVPRVGASHAPVRPRAVRPRRQSAIRAGLCPPALDCPTRTTPLRSRTDAQYHGTRARSLLGYLRRRRARAGAARLFRLRRAFDTQPVDRPRAALLAAQARRRPGAYGPGFARARRRATRRFPGAGGGCGARQTVRGGPARGRSRGTALFCRTGLDPDRRTSGGVRAHETPEHLVCRLLLEKKKKKK